MIDIHSLTFGKRSDMLFTGGEKMRITKEPEERKQEILDMAIKLFNEKGYEKTSIADIASAIGVAQGLCYRYFPSKETLFDCAIEQYAHLLTEKFVLPAEANKKPLKQIIEEIPITVEEESSNYYKIFHEPKNRKFHNQLALKVCENLVPFVTKLLEVAKTKGEIDFPDTKTAAEFCIYGQLGLLLNQTLSQENKSKQIQEFLIYALRL